MNSAQASAAEVDEHDRHDRRRDRHQDPGQQVGAAAWRAAPVGAGIAGRSAWPASGARGLP